MVNIMEVKKVPSYLVKVSAKNRKVDYVTVPKNMSAPKKAEFDKKRKTTFKDYQQIQAACKDEAVTKALRKKKLINKSEKAKFKKTVKKHKTQFDNPQFTEIADFDLKDFSFKVF